MNLKVKSNGINFNVPTIENLPTEHLEEDLVCVVTNENRGGVFVYREANALVNNGGTIFNGWTRQYDGSVNVKWFGAVGDGITDDTVAIQLAINYCSSTDKIGNTIIAKDSIFKTTSTININNSITLKFENSSINSSGVNTFYFGDSSYLTNLSIGYHRIIMHRVNINHSGSGSAIKNDGVRHIAIIECSINGGLNALSTEGAWGGSYIQSSKFISQTGNSIELKQRNNLFRIQNSSVLASGGYGINMSTVSAELKGIKLLGVDFEGNKGALTIGGNTGNIDINGCWFENNTIHNIKLLNTAGTYNKFGVTISNCQITGIGVDVLIGTDTSGTLISGVSIFSNEFVNSDLVVIGNGKVVNFVEHSNRLSETSVITLPTPQKINNNVDLPSCSVMPLYSVAPDIPWGSGDTTGRLGEIRWDTDSIYVRNTTGWGYIPIQFSSSYSYLRTPKQKRSTSIPTTGSWNQGDISWNSSPTASSYIGWVCTTTGTFGTLSGVTGSITISTNQLTVNDATNLSIGMNITIVGVTGVKKITAVNGLVLTLDSTSSATVTSAAVAYQTPVFKTFGAISA